MSQDAHELEALVGTVGSRPPPPAVFVVESDAELQPVLAGGGRPPPDHVLFGADPHGVSGLILGVPEIKIVVVNSLNHHETHPRVGKRLGQLVGIPMRGFPGIEDILVLELGRVSEVLEVIEIGFAPLLVEVAGIPVPAPSGGLGSPMDEDAELCVTEPLRNAGIILPDGITPEYSKARKLS